MATARLSKNKTPNPEKAVTLKLSRDEANMPLSLLGEAHLKCPTTPIFEALEDLPGMDICAYEPTEELPAIRMKKILAAG